MNAVAPSGTPPTARLRQLDPGVHHAGRMGDGAWVMIGRDLPDRFTWSSVPPASSLSVLWGAGACTVEDASNTVTLLSDEALWIPEACAHRGDGAAGSDFLTLFWVEPSERPSERSLPRGNGIRSVSCAGSTRTALLRVAALLLDGAPDAALANDLETVRSVVYELADDAPAEPMTLTRAEAVLLERFDEALPISAFSTLARQSAPQFTRFFRRAWGLAPIQFRKQLRLLQATHALLEGRSVTRAALDAGFSDTAHFTRTFRDQYGRPPSAWAREVRGSSPEG
ncbi:MAG: AraC family transcriptional regulator [Bacteroidota bacterium]